MLDKPPFHVNDVSLAKWFNDIWLKFPRVGKATLVAGTVTVNETRVTANTVIIVSRMTTGGTVGHLSTTSVVGTSFTINSTSATETSVIGYILLEP